MNRPGLRWRARLAALITGGALIVALFPMAGTALAAVSVTGVTGGGAISADTGPTPTGTGAWTGLGGPIVNEGAPGDIPASGTLTLTLTGNYAFNTGAAVGAGMSVSVGACGLTVSSPSVAANTITMTLGGTATTGSNRCRLTLSGIEVHPTSGTVPNVGSLAFSGAFSGAAGTLTMVEGAPILAFGVQPSPSGTGGVPLAQSPHVTVADRFGNVPPGSVTLSVASGPGTVSCTANPVTPVAGVASFSGCSLDHTGTYTLRATMGTGSAVSNQISITAGAAAKLVFYQQPLLGVVGVAFPSQPYVGVADAGGNILTSGSYTVTLAISSNPGGGTLTCTSGLSVPTQITSAGVLAQYSGCRISNAGIGYTLSAATGGLTSGLTASFDVENQLAFFIQPAGAVAGAAFTTQPSVAVEINGVPATHDNTTVVTLGIRSGTGATGAILTCTSGLTMTVASGVASFSGCSIDRLSPTGNPYQLVASTLTGLGTVISTAFAVTVGPPVKVGFTTQPTTANVAAVFAVSPVVAIQDAGGNTITTSSASVTLALGSNPGGGTLSCTGGLTRTAVSGVVTFTGCSINLAGSGYTLVASSSGLTSATSSAFAVSAPAAVLTLLRSTGMVAYPDAVTLTVQFAASGANRPVFLEYTYAGIPWTTVASTTASPTGFASVTYRPPRSGYYRVRFDGATDLSAAYSNVILVGVRQVITLNPTHPGTLTINRGREITFRGTVKPLGLAGVQPTVTFRFYQRRSGVWTLRATRNVVADSTGVARTTFRFAVSGSWYVMAFAATTRVNAVSRFSQREYYLVR
jgi:hypothetical protein